MAMWLCGYVAMWLLVHTTWAPKDTILILKDTRNTQKDTILTLKDTVSTSKHTKKHEKTLTPKKTPDNLKKASAACHLR